MLMPSRLALLGALFLAASLFLVGCGGGGGDGPSAGGKPAFDLAVEGVRSVSYGPLFLQDQSCLEQFSSKCATGFVTDDFAADWAQPIWSSSGSGRGDLANIAGLGANAVRLYGNDPRFDKGGFLTEARKQGLQVIDGMSSYWYNEAGGPLCATSNPVNCHDVIHKTYGDNLDGGFMEGDTYHTALTIINVMNEPDFLGLGDQGNPNYLLAMLTAFDGILSAEAEKGVKPWSDGTLPRLTITWSFATRADNQVVCSEKYFIHDVHTECGPGVIFMVQFYRVVMNPHLLGYVPKNDIKTAYNTRWINGVNLFVDAQQIELQLATPYSALSFLKGTKLFIGEWHPKPEDTPEKLKIDLQTLSKAPSANASFIGASYFQYQVAYNKFGTEREFGMFNLGSKVIGYTNYITTDSAPNHPVNCLNANPPVAAITEAWKGAGAKHGLCPEDDAKASAVVV